MKIKSIIFTFLILFICGVPIPGSSQELTADLFQPSSLVSREIAQKQIKKIYLTSGKRRTFHCGCVFDKLKQVFPDLCGGNYRPERDKREPIELEWHSLMPASVFAKTLSCWRKPLCDRPNGKKVKGTQCCSEVSPKFKTMESDMHNMFPMVKISETDTFNRHNNFSGMWEYRYCKGKAGKEGTLRKEIRGDASRTYLYMSFQYKISLEDSLEDKLRAWHFEDPSNEWEEKRNDMIEVIQGNRNPFIDRPELVEKVPDF